MEKEACTLRVHYSELVEFGFARELANGCSGWYYIAGAIYPSIEDVFSKTSRCGGTHSGRCSAICFLKDDAHGPFASEEDATKDMEE